MAENLTRAERYARWWAPVLAPTALGLLDLVDDMLGARPDPVVGDVGTGTGTLSIAAATRWPGATVIGVDPDREMLALARSQAEEELGPRAHTAFVAGKAEALPFRDSSVDAIVSAFTFQYVDRAVALREAARVLQPEGAVAIVTWQGPRPPFRPRAVLSETLLEFRLTASDWDRRSQNLAGPESSLAAVAELERAGFVGVRAEVAQLEYRWEPDAFLEWKEYLDDREWFDALDRQERQRVVERLRSRLSQLHPDDFVVPDPVVCVTGAASASKSTSKSKLRSKSNLESDGSGV